MDEDRSRDARVPSEGGAPGAGASDHSLLRRFRAGEQDAATELYLRYSSRLLGLANRQTSEALSARLDADDIVQSVFRTFFRRVADGCYDVPPGDELWQLLLVLALNKIRSQATYHRAKKRDVGATVSAEQVAGASDASRGDDERSLQILELTVEEALHELPPSHQQMIRMRIEGHSVQEIADETERAKRSVERVLKNFRDRMQKLVQDSPDSDNHESHEP
ncbi:MAG: sigma-70 family RNA polymerase sigma factor [Planctomycetales bacterium]|nr:sigma-70 family RNA polymerase sigma factor [Planctomycetales bacterium]